MLTFCTFALAKQKSTNLNYIYNGKEKRIYQRSIYWCSNSILLCALHSVSYVYSYLNYEVRRIDAYHALGSIFIYNVLYCFTLKSIIRMLKEELEKQLGVEVTMVFYVTANGMYVQGPYRNNREFCEMLKQDKLLMVSLRQCANIRSMVRKKIREQEAADFKFIRDIQIQ